MSNVKTRKISTARARRIALAAQGFATPRPEGPVTMRHLGRMIDQIGLIQIGHAGGRCKSAQFQRNRQLRFEGKYCHAFDAQAAALADGPHRQGGLAAGARGG